MEILAEILEEILILAVSVFLGLLFIELMWDSGLLFFIVVGWLLSGVLLGLVGLGSLLK